MNLHNERHVDLTAYRPLPEDEFGLTPRQIAERRTATRLVTQLRYDSEINMQRAEEVMSLPVAALMRMLEIDEEQAEDLKGLAKRHLKRCELTGVK